jgi:hypothetical protein
MARMARFLCKKNLNVFDMGSNKQPVVKVERIVLGELLFIVS